MAAQVWGVAVSLLILAGLQGGVVVFVAVAQGQVPAMFVLGDSLVDPGNNNDLLTLAKANYWPYGIDFPEGVTGRYCNGGTVVDHLGFLLGLPLIPAFNDLSPSGSMILQGVNYASAAGGILNYTGEFYGQRIAMDEQIENFKCTLQELRSLMVNRLEDYLAKSLFFVAMGSNDYINNYLLPISVAPSIYTPEAFLEILIQEYTRQLKDLYDLGARKFLVVGIGPLGCIPNQIGSSNSTDKCVERTNQLASAFNSRLKVMLQKHNVNLKGSNFLYWDTYSSVSDVLNNFSKYGFKYRYKACCGGGHVRGQIICLPLLPLCSNRSEYVFWDPYHPTDAFNVISAKQAYQGNLQTSFPRNVQQLIQI